MGFEWVPFEFSVGQGWFEVVEDEELLAEIFALKEALARGGAGPSPTRGQEQEGPR